MISLHKHLGLSGIDDNESEFACHVGRVFSVVSLIIVYVIAFQWQMYRKAELMPWMDQLINWGVWLSFALYLSISLSLVNSKAHFLAGNWMILVIILGGIAFLVDYSPIASILQSLRPLLIIYLLVPWLDIAYQSLSDNKLVTTLFTALFVLLLAGTLIAGIDPAISGPRQGIWWAWVTMSTVGFGDIVPVSGMGQIFASLLILMGLGLFSIITANFSAIFVQREVQREVKNVQKESEQIRLILQNMQAIKSEEENLEKMLIALNERIHTIEKYLQSK